MRFMVIMIPGSRAKYEGGAMPDPKLLDAMMKYNEELSKAGVMLGGEGLHPSSKGALIRFSGGKPTVTDGPFTETRELIGGFWMWQVKSKAEALEWARRCPAQDGDTLELRQVQEPEDFGPEVAKKEHALMDEIARRNEQNQKR